MTKSEVINVALVGAGGRSESFLNVFQNHPRARLYALCDSSPDVLAESMRTYGIENGCEDYQELLDNPDIHAVIVSTPMHLHAEHSIRALEKKKHVLSEVTPAVSLEQCRELVSAVRRANTVFMLGENMVYTRLCLLIKQLIHKGLLGDVYYAHAEYLHNIKDLMIRTPWRRKWHVGIDGITYGTHSLGPVLQWFANERIDRLTCQGSGRHHTDSSGRPLAQDTSLMMCKTDQDHLISIRVDLMSPHPFEHNFFLQGSEGCCCLSYGTEGLETGRISFKHKDHEIWQPIDDEFISKYYPDFYHDPLMACYSALKSSSHWGCDYIMLMHFLDIISGFSDCLLDIDTAMDQTLPGLISQESIAQNGRWLCVPDSRTWTHTE